MSSGNLFWCSTMTQCCCVLLSHVQSHIRTRAWHYYCHTCSVCQMHVYIWKFKMFWDVLPCGLVSRWWYFDETYTLRLWEFPNKDYVILFVPNKIMMELFIFLSFFAFPLQNHHPNIASYNPLRCVIASTRLLSIITSVFISWVLHLSDLAPSCL